LQPFGLSIDFIIVRSSSVFRKESLMKNIIAFAFLVFFASASLAQEQIQEQLPASVQADTTSGWKINFSNPHYTFAYIKFFDQPENQIGYAVCGSGPGRFLLLRTTNIGETWDSLSTLVPALPVFFLTPQLGFCTSGNVDSVWKTTDGGQSWKASYRNTSHNGQLIFSNPDTGLVIGNNEVARTTDGGKTWKQIEFFNVGASEFTDASFGDNKTCYAVSPLSPFFPQQHATDPWTGGCMKSTNAGLTWTQLNTGINTSLGCCFAFDAKTVVVAAWSAYVGRTTNGGVTWDTTSIVNPNAGFEAISFLSKGRGLLVGGDVFNNFMFGIVYSSSDSGKTWHRQYAPNLTVLYGVSCLNDSIAFAYGDSGRIYRTMTGGNFSSVTQHTIDFHVQTFPNPATGNITIQYQLPSTQQVSFTFYNVQGVTIGTLNPGIQNDGVHQVVYDGSALPNGVYYFRLTTPQDSFTGSFTIQK
jgi:photosystem II stability/assembly factor-like uncharacterized protein